MKVRSKLRWIIGVAIALLLIPVVNVLSYGALSWLNGAGYISPYRVAGLNRTRFYPLFKYRQSTLPGADSLDAFYYDCLKAGAESQTDRDQ